MTSSAVDKSLSARTTWRLTPLPALVLTAGLPVLISIWMLLSPGRMVSREMTFDMLFNLAGAWHVFQGHLPHVDFHDPHVAALDVDGKTLESLTGPDDRSYDLVVLHSLHRRLDPAWLDLAPVILDTTFRLAHPKAVAL